jgi:hypothetical protein
VHAKSALDAAAKATFAAPTASRTPPVKAAKVCSIMSSYADEGSAFEGFARFIIGIVI